MQAHRRSHVGAQPPRPFASVRRRILIALALLTWHGTAASQARVDHALGEFESAATTNGLLIAAPHGSFDINSDAIAKEVARELGAGYVLARKFAPDKVRLNVNRPTEGASLACAQEQRSERAGEVYTIYSRLVAAASDKPLRLFVEIHGNSLARSAQHVEVATVGISAAQARRVKDGYPAMLSRAIEHSPAYPELNLLIEPLDSMYFTASCAKSIGIFATKFGQPAIHIEFPRAARESRNLQGSASLAADIVRSIMQRE
ncbi:MAG: hypothetical protein D4R74_12425 [Betaproteobacteria bacterium]|nr:MAG: hypothetical protein D4R74_12425 [Betaproteobacteria bacterium]